MDGFRPALNGYFDAADQLPRYLRRRAEAGFAAEREAKRAIDSRSAFEARRERVRTDFLSALGGLPESPDNPAVETTGVTERDGYTVEQIVFESLSDFHVTANCYVPDSEGPHPGVLFLCGHVAAAKADPENQRACIELALNNFVVLVIDPIAQGEREQYRDPAIGEAFVEGGGGVFAHCYLGQQCFYAGVSLARYMIHDARRCLDALANRSDVDDDRLGVIGTSGGGVQTSYLALIDDRIAAAALCCSITERDEWLKTGKRIDAEQLIYAAIPRGINYDDFVTAMAPRPVCVGAATSDEYFPIEGVHQAVERARGVYDLYDARENLELVVADAAHCSVYELGDGVFEWLCEHLSDEEYISHDDRRVVEETDLRCTPEGSVRAAYPDERTVHDLLRDYVAEHYPGAGTPPVDAGMSPGNAEASSAEGHDGDETSSSTTDRHGDVERVRQSLIERFDLDRASPERYPRYIQQSEWEGLTIEHLFFRTERAPDIVVAGVLVSDPDAATSGESGHPPAVVCYEDGTDALADRREDVAALVAAHGTVLVFDPRGVGAVRNRAIPIPSWVEDYYGVYGTEFKLAYDALFLGESLFGMRVHDVCEAIAFLRAETGERQVALVGDGIGAYHALYAVGVDEHVGAVELRDLGPSFHDIATRREYPYDPRLTAVGMLGDYDIPRVLETLRDRGVTVQQPPD